MVKCPVLRLKFAQPKLSNLILFFSCSEYKMKSKLYLKYEQMNLIFIISGRNLFYLEPKLNKLFECDMTTENNNEDDNNNNNT